MTARTVWTCLTCLLISDPGRPPEVTQLATIHNLVHHRGAPHATPVTITQPTPARVP